MLYQKYKPKFIDLFSGIGGLRLAFESVEADCVYSAEIDAHAIEMYKVNFGDNSEQDIREIIPENLPDFDILCAGFPCQAFSICGKQKGFQDATRGTLFFDILRIVRAKLPKIIVLENVQHLEKHDKGNTLFVIVKTLNELGYSVSYKVLNARDYGVPQNRERIVIVCNRNGLLFDFDKLETNRVESMKPFLDKSGVFEVLNECEYTLLNKTEIKQQKSGLIFCGYRNKKIRNTGVRDGTEHLSRVHKQPNRIYSSSGIHPTLASQEKSGRYYIYDNGIARKLTLKECYRFMGFPDDFKLVGSKAKLYERIGNSVCVPMFKEIAKEIIKQFYGKENNMEEKENTRVFLENAYINSLNLKNTSLTEEQRENVQTIVNYEENLKGVFTVLVTSLVYKTLHPEQDIRNHQANMENGYSGRTFDTNYITPFLKEKSFLGAMKESGWLTRSLEQSLPYNLDFPGKINNLRVKDAFLHILNDVEINKANPYEYLLYLFNLSIRERDRKAIVIATPIVKESKMSIDEILNILNNHFYYSNNIKGTSILPVVALYSIYQCITQEVARFNGKFLEPLSSHYSCDKNSKNAGDIVIRNPDGSLYEVVEVKFDIPPTSIMVEDGYKKIYNTSIQRYYILSTAYPKEDELEKIQSKINRIRNEHGCQIIVNGVFDTLKYYLRLMWDTDKFMTSYINNIQHNSELNYEHKNILNQLIGQYNSGI
ncbi:TPA: DNA (cytosine-5-)-methyltransferase [Campylobacter coli]|nr:DNA (cytosine-5-)-methyltransferase [Campylobacter coli]HEH4506762.1 DNA (cytosine-5-)-methyltransferase [Campylobacter coli]HEH4509891.1 DNA (cytosine-5-)-methyltransferase [Campylobacter coli]HEH5541160.1 DNA (cytosine-5-)-methyltransferase [Campylobacter coli]